MRKTRLLTAAIVIGALAGVPDLAAAMGDSSPPPPPANPNTKQPPMKPTSSPPPSKSSGGKRGALDDFYSGYHKAYALIYDQGYYAGGIAVLRAMGYDDHPDVATLIGYASRKLGRYDDAKYWYERALAADPNHVKTWSYYGMWHAEQGNLLKAKDDLEKVRAICGNTTCPEYTALKEAIDGTVTY
jgi:tetratricopeptide (TPR) repeat protein